MLGSCSWVGQRTRAAAAVQAGARHAAALCAPLPSPQQCTLHSTTLPDRSLLNTSPSMQMLALLGGKERSRQEWASLLAAGGFRLVAVHPLRSAYSLIEAVLA